MYYNNGSLFIFEVTDMKKAISIILSLAIVLCSTFAFSQAVYAENGLVDEPALPERPSDCMVEKIGPTTIKIAWYRPYYSEQDGFEIAKYNASTKKYTHLAYAKGDAFGCTIKNLKKNTKYVLAVRGYINANGKKYYGKYSKTFSSRTSPTETTLSGVKYVSAGKMKVSWKKVSGVSGYVIKYSPSSSFKNRATICTAVVSGDSKTSKTLSGLAKKKYYVKVCTYKTTDGKRYLSDYSRTKSVTIKKGVSVKSMLNAVSSDTSGKKEIKKATDNGVDISKYKTTYDRFKAIYNWHSKHNTAYGWNCVGCNSNFIYCLEVLFENSNKKYDEFIALAAGKFKNSNGSKVQHKWAVIYLAGVPYIFDPRLQGYTSNKTGTTYFGVTKGSSVGKKYLFDYWYYEPSNIDCGVNNMIVSEAKPGMVKATAKAKKGAAKLSWKKVKSAKGYQIKYSTKSNFSSAKYITVSNADTLSKTISKLSSKKTYYIKIRAYKQPDNSKYYGFWSSTIKVKTK